VSHESDLSVNEHLSKPCFLPAIPRARGAQWQLKRKFENSNGGFMPRDDSYGTGTIDY
jgi:hypothetical protein